MGGKQSTSSGGNGEPGSLQELRSSFADAQEEVNNISQELLDIKTKLDSANATMDKIVEQEEEIGQQRNTLLLECYDASIHKCITAAEAQFHPEIDIAEFLTPPPQQQKRSDTQRRDKPQQQQRSEGGEGQEIADKEEDDDDEWEETPEQKLSRYEREYKKIMLQRKVLNSKFQDILNALAKGRDDVEGNVFKLERRMINLEEALVRANQEVARLALEVRAEERKHNVGLQMATLEADMKREDQRKQDQSEEDSLSLVDNQRMEQRQTGESEDIKEKESSRSESVTPADVKINVQ